MTTTMLDYTKSILEKVSFDTKLFKRELKKALKSLLPKEVEELLEWLQEFTETKPQLKPIVLSIKY